jgi:hypothetical protein
MQIQVTEQYFVPTLQKLVLLVMVYFAAGVTKVSNHKDKLPVSFRAFFHEPNNSTMD